MIAEGVLKIPKLRPVLSVDLQVTAIGAGATFLAQTGRAFKPLCCKCDGCRKE